MKQSEVLKEKQAAVEAELEKVCDRLFGDNDKSEQEMTELRNRFHELHGETQMLDTQIRTERNREIEVGDGVTVTYWSDREAYTVIRKTTKTITIQRDKAILADDFKPEFITGGFSAHCTNNADQHYVYLRDPNGETKVARWSEKHGCYRVDGTLRVSVGRHEFYDYNYHTER